jgi:glycosyltransferase involved in cell wall biosynthesis
VTFDPRHPFIHRMKYSWTCDGLVAVSESVRNVLIQTGIPEHKIAVIHTGIAIPPALPTADQRAEARQKFDLPEDAFVIGHMGAFTPEKGQDIAIAAAAAVRASLPHVHFLFAGIGPRISELLNRAAANTHFPGFIENRSEFFAALDLFMMPSRSEAWGLAALEAMAHGIPVIASNIGGLREIVEPGKTGWLVPPNDAVLLADAIRSAETGRAALAEFAIAARQHAGQFSIQTMAEKIEMFYRRLLDRKR